MRARQRFVWLLTVAAALATAALALTRGVVDVVVMAAVVATLAGSYGLRRHARAALVYRNRAPGSPPDGPATPPPQATGHRAGLSAERLNRSSRPSDHLEQEERHDTVASA